MKGIPTTYAGVDFRSRAEARWAAFFDLVGWPWEYEPFDMGGYIPDFSLTFPAGAVLVEVKGGAPDPFAAAEQDGGKLAAAVVNTYRERGGGDERDPFGSRQAGLVLAAHPPASSGEPGPPSLGLLCLHGGAGFTWGDAHLIMSGPPCDRPCLPSARLSLAVTLFGRGHRGFNECLTCGAPDETESCKGPHRLMLYEEAEKAMRSAWASACNVTRWSPRRAS